jgi:hypothetical protein
MIRKLFLVLALLAVLATRGPLTAVSGGATRR